MSARRYKARARKRKQKSDESRLESQEVTKHETITGEIVTDDGGAGVLSDSRHFRGDARDIAKLISLGVVPHDKAQQAIARAFEMAIATNDERRYAAAMKIILAAGKLEIEDRKSNVPKLPQANFHLHANIPDAEPAGYSLSAITAKIGLHGLAERYRRRESGASG